MPKKELVKKSVAEKPERPRGIPRRRRKKAASEPRYSNYMSYEELVELEAQWGGTMFGQIPAGHQRKFFEHKKNVWIWYEGWLDPAGVEQGMTIRYEVRPAGVFKRVSGQKYEKLVGDELDNFRLAAKNYLKLMKSKLYY